MTGLLELFGMKVLEALAGESITSIGGVVYFIQRENGGDIKIGYTNDIERRLKTLQTGNADRLVVLGLIRGDQALEASLHRKFAIHRVRKDGEWFRPALEIKSYINANCFNKKSKGLLETVIDMASGAIVQNLGINNQEVVSQKQVVISDNVCMNCGCSEETKFVKVKDNMWCLKDGREVRRNDTCGKFVLNKKQI